MSRRFYFDVDNRQQIVRDDDGVEAEDFEQALADARSVISEVTAELDVTNLSGPCSIIVRDETGSTVAHVPLGLSPSHNRSQESKHQAAIQSALAIHRPWFCTMSRKACGGGGRGPAVAITSRSGPRAQRQRARHRLAANHPQTAP